MDQDGYLLLKSVYVLTGTDLVSSGPLRCPQDTLVYRQRESSAQGSGLSPPNDLLYSTPFSFSAVIHGLLGRRFRLGPCFLSGQAVCNHK